MKRLLLLFFAFIAATVVVVSCSDDDDNGTKPATPEQLLTTSLHRTTAGMEYFYSEDQGGFEQFTSIPYANLECKNCHVEPANCNTCHVEDGDTPQNSTCLDVCHGRQKAEQGANGTGPNADYHLKPVAAGGEGMLCADCHSAQQVHGDGQSYTSLLANPNNVTCTQSGCHTNLPSNSFHTQHGASDFECQACHSRATLNCYNCHFESEVNLKTKVAFKQIADWKFLVKEKSSGKITTGNFMAMTYQGKSFYTVAPYYSHTIHDGAGMTCGTCHNSAAVVEYKATGTMTLTTFDDGAKTLANTTGVIPIPTNWSTAIKLDYLTKDVGGAWVKQSSTPDATQMLFADPINVTNLPVIQ